MKYLILIFISILSTSSLTASEQAKNIFDIKIDISTDGLPLKHFRIVTKEGSSAKISKLENENEIAVSLIPTLTDISGREAIHLEMEIFKNGRLLGRPELIVFSGNNATMTTSEPESESLKIQILAKKL